MNFFSKGDFNIEDSWLTDTTKRSKVKTNQRKSNPTTQSLMFELAESLTQSSSDIYDDSLSQLMINEKQQSPFNFTKRVAQSRNQQVGTQLLSNQQIQNVNFTEQMENASNTKAIIKSTAVHTQHQKQQIERIQLQNAFLKGIKSYSKKSSPQIQQLKAKNQQLNKKMNQMETYLKKYGVSWVGDQLKGKLDDKSIKQQIKQSKYAYRLPSQIDISTVQRRIEDLNAGLEAEGLSTEVYNEKGVHKLRKVQPLPITFHSNGIAIKGLNFYPYSGKQSLKVLGDLIDGYFPYVLKTKYPNGIMMNVVDRIEQPYKEQKLNKQTRKSVACNTSISSMQQQKKKQKPNQNRVAKNNSNIKQIDGLFYIQTSCWSKIEEGAYKQQQVCTLKIRDENSTMYILQMQKQKKMIHVYEELRKVIKVKLTLMTNYPHRIYPQKQQSSLEILGFFPKQTLFIKHLS